MSEQKKTQKTKHKSQDKISVEIAMRIAVDVDAPVGVEAADITAALCALRDGGELSSIQQRAFDGLMNSIKASDEYSAACTNLALAATEHRNEFPSADISYTPVLGFIDEIPIDDIEEEIKDHG
jgi:hypothetical protein